MGEFCKRSTKPTIRKTAGGGVPRHEIRQAFSVCRKLCNPWHFFFLFLFRATRPTKSTNKASKILDFILVNKVALLNRILTP